MENFQDHYIEACVEQNEQVTLEGISGLITNDKGQILLMNHTKFECWTIPVGKPEEGESLEDAIKREMYEELDIQVDNLVAQGRVLYRSGYDEGSPLQANTIFRIRNFSGNIINKEGLEKCLDLVFVDPVELWNRIKNGEKTTTATIKALEILINQQES